MTTSGEGGNLFDRAVIMLIITVVTINFCNLLKMNGFHGVSETSVYVLIGILTSIIVIFAMHSDANIKLSSTFFQFVLLPPIIFEGGFTLQRVTFVRNLIPILSLALVGAIYSTLVTSLLMYAATRVLKPEFTLLENFVFGAIISSTDPISVLGMLPPSTDRNLYMLIFGESALNDAVAVILYRLFEHLVEEEKKSISTLQLFEAIGESLWIFIKSAGVGIIVALMFAKLTKHVRPPEAPIFELLMFLVFPYCGYLLCEVVEGTGIIGIFFSGLTMAHYAYDNLSKITLLSAKIVLRTLSTLSDAFIFLYLGMGLLAFHPNTTYNPGIIAAGIISILISRTHVFLIGAIHNWFNKTVIHRENKRIPLNHLIFLWFCGLRGAVSFALSVQILDIPAFNHDGVQSTLFGTVVVVVIFTVLVFGSLTPWMMKWLKLDGDQSDQTAVQSLETPPAPQQPQSKQSSQAMLSPVTSAKTASLKSPTFPKQPQTIKKRTSLSTIDEYVQQPGSDNPEVEAADFMDVVNDSFWMKLYQFDRRYLIPFFRVDVKRIQQQSANSRSSIELRATGASAAAGVGNSNMRPTHVLGSDSSLDNMVYEIKNQNVVSALDADSTERLDMAADDVPLSVAAEMFGIAGSTKYNYQLNGSTFSVAPSTSVQADLAVSPAQTPSQAIGGRISRASSITSLHRAAIGGASAAAAVAEKKITIGRLGSISVTAGAGSVASSPSTATNNRSQFSEFHFGTQPPPPKSPLADGDSDMFSLNDEDEKLI